MKKLTLFLISVLLLSISMLAQPKAVFSEEKFDFGNINQGDIVSHDFVIKNEGTEALTIDKVRASCGCTAAKPDVEKLAPGESTKISVKFDSHGRKGVQKKYVYVFTNDPETPQMRLFFTTNIVVDAEAVPKNIKGAQIVFNIKEVDFGEMAEGEVKSTQLSFVNRGKADLIINDIKSSCDCVSATVSTKKISPYEVAFLNIKFDSKGRTGDLTRTVTLYTNDTNNPQESVVIYAKVHKGDKS